MREEAPREGVSCFGAGSRRSLPSLPTSGSFPGETKGREERQDFGSPGRPPGCNWLKRQGHVKTLRDIPEPSTLLPLFKISIVQGKGKKKFFSFFFKQLPPLHVNIVKEWE